MTLSTCDERVWRMPDRDIVGSRPCGMRAERRAKSTFSRDRKLFSRTKRRFESELSIRFRIWRGNGGVYRLVWRRADANLFWKKKSLRNLKLEHSMKRWLAVEYFRIFYLLFGVCKFFVLFLRLLQLNGPDLFDSKPKNVLIILNGNQTRW